MGFRDLYIMQLEIDGIMDEYHSTRKLYDTFCALFGEQSDSYMIWDEVGEYVRRYTKS